MDEKLPCLHAHLAGVLTVIAFAAVIVFAWGNVVVPQRTTQIILGSASETVGRTVPREAGTER